MLFRSCGRKRNAPPRPPNAEPSSSRTSPPTSRRTTHELFPLLSYNHHQWRLAHPAGGTTKRKLNSPVTYPSRPDRRARDPRPHTSALHTRTCPSRPTAFLINTRNARAPTSTRSIGFCVIWVCISSSSSSVQSSPVQSSYNEPTERGAQLTSVPGTCPRTSNRRGV